MQTESDVVFIERSSQELIDELEKLQKVRQSKGRSEPLFDLYALEQELEENPEVISLDISFREHMQDLIPSYWYGDRIYLFPNIGTIVIPEMETEDYHPEEEIGLEEIKVREDPETVQTILQMYREYHADLVNRLEGVVESNSEVKSGKTNTNFIERHPNEIIDQIRDIEARRVKNSNYPAESKLEKLEEEIGEHPNVVVLDLAFRKTIDHPTWDSDEIYLFPTEGIVVIIEMQREGPHYEDDYGLEKIHIKEDPEAVGSFLEMYREYHEDVVKKIDSLSKD